MLYLMLLLPLKYKLWLSSLVFAILNCGVFSYNLDVFNAKVFDNPTKSQYRRGNYFGFSVALYVNGNDSVLLVGAPRANTSIIQAVVEPGTVYQCPINKTCKEWVVDRSPNGAHRKNSTVQQIKDNAWIGATVAVENKTNPKVVVCGPRWKNNIINGNRPYWYMNGICYWTVANNVNSFNQEATNELIPFLHKDQVISYTGINIYNYGMGQAGFSLHMTSDKLYWDLALGSPGVFNWRGAPLLASSVFNSGDTIIPSTGNKVQFGDYFGYAITSGCYFKEGENWFASGAPRGADLKGKVIIFAFPSMSNRLLNTKKIIDGEQHGEYFGAALASCDLNNDSKDELIVGAPQWSKDMDEGRIYIFTARYNENLDAHSFNGETPGSKFGSTITCLGDIDYDGYGDFAVGAPYENENGAIYIFNGNSNGLFKQYSQKISGIEFGKDVRGFGISISPPNDINRDKYSDIAVGAYLSGHAVLLKSKPSVTVITKLAQIQRTKLLRNSTSFLIDLCTSYDGIYAPEHIRIVRLLKIDPMYGRATYNSKKNNENTYHLPETLQKARKSCNELKINLKENIQNIIDPIEISVSVILEDDILPSTTKKSLFCTSCAIINKLLSKTEDVMKLPFAVDCGEDNICTSDVRIILSTNLKSNNTFVIGSTPTVKLYINVQNEEEPAYQTKVFVYIPEVLPLANIPPECMEGLRINNSLEVICDVGNPLRKEKTLTLELDMRELQLHIDHVELWANVSTQSDDKNLHNNIYNLTMNFDVESDVVIVGKPQKDQYSYFGKDGEKKLDNIQFQHIFEVQKFGVSPTDNIVLTINVPTYWKHSSGDIKIITINQTIGIMNGQSFYCLYTNRTRVPSSSVNHKHNTSAHATSFTHEKIIAEQNSSSSVLSNNKPVYINCTNTVIKCEQMDCELGSFKSSLSVAKLILTLDLQLSNFQPDMIEGKDILFVSEGSVNITEKTGHQLDTISVTTKFLSARILQQVAIWIIVLSVFLGIILLILLILGLIKVGFFNRKKKEELEALKAETDRKHGIILETNSSQEVLDQD